MTVWYYLLRLRKKIQYMVVTIIENNFLYSLAKNIFLKYVHATRKEQSVNKLINN